MKNLIVKMPPNFSISYIHETIKGIKQKDHYKFFETFKTKITHLKHYLYIYIKPKLLKLPQFSTSAQH